MMCPPASEFGDAPLYAPLTVDVPLHILSRLRMEAQAQQTTERALASSIIVSAFSGEEEQQ